jgi:hypothetical protein
MLLRCRLELGYCVAFRGGMEDFSVEPGPETEVASMVRLLQKIREP